MVCDDVTGLANVDEVAAVVAAVTELAVDAAARQGGVLMRFRTLTGSSRHETTSTLTCRQTPPRSNLRQSSNWALSSANQQPSFSTAWTRRVGSRAMSTLVAAYATSSATPGAAVVEEQVELAVWVMSEHSPATASSACR